MDTKTLEKRTSIKIKVSTHEKLKKKAIYGETMDEVINRCMFEDNIKSKTKKAHWEKKV